MRPAPADFAVTLAPAFISQDIELLLFESCSTIKEERVVYWPGTCPESLLLAMFNDSSAVKQLHCCGSVPVSLFHMTLRF